MALDFPNAPTDGQVYTATSGEQWIYETATNSWTSKGLVNTAGGLQYKGDVNITAAPPAGVTSGWQYSVNPGGTANAGFGPGVTGAIAKGSMLMYTGTGWIETSHVVPDATPTAKGIDTRKWDRTGTTLSPATAGDVVTVSGGTAPLPGLTPVGDPNTGIYSPGADRLAISTGGIQRATIDSSGKLLVGTSTSRAAITGNEATVQIEKVGTGITGQALSVTDNRAEQYGPKISLIKSRGSTLGSFTIVQSNDEIGAVSFIGTDGSKGLFGAQIAAFVDGTPGANDMPGRLVFSTTADGAAVPTERMRIDSTGLVTLAGPGIRFPATAVASTDPNTLDDYEEGTWTPTATNFTLGGLSTLTGTYTKIGRVVYFSVTFVNTGTIAYGASASITLPFAGVDRSGMVAMSLEKDTEPQAGRNGVQNLVDAASSRFFVGSFATTTAGQQLNFAGFYITF